MSRSSVRQHVRVPARAGSAWWKIQALVAIPGGCGMPCRNYGSVTLSVQINGVHVGELARTGPAEQHTRSGIGVTRLA